MIFSRLLLTLSWWELMVTETVETLETLETDLKSSSILVIVVRTYNCQMKTFHSTGHSTINMTD